MAATVDPTQPPCEGDDAIACALKVLLQKDPHAKAEYTKKAAALWRAGRIPAVDPRLGRRAAPERPARDDEKVRCARCSSYTVSVLQHRRLLSSQASGGTAEARPAAGPPAHPPCLKVTTRAALLPLGKHLLCPRRAGQARAPQPDAQARQGRLAGLAPGAAAQVRSPLRAGAVDWGIACCFAQPPFYVCALTPLRRPEDR